MEESRKDWVSLLMGYLRKDLSEGELEELHRQRNSSAIKQELFDKFTDPEQMRRDFQLHYKIDIEKAWNKFLPNLPAPKPAPKRKIGFNIKAVWNFLELHYRKVAFVVILGAVFLLVRQTNDDQRFSALTSPTLEIGDGTRINILAVADGVFSVDGELFRKEGSMIVVSNKKGNGKKRKLVTPAGQQFSVQLSDGSVARLNANSSITFPDRFEEKQREVTITGESYLTVNKESDRPFIVQTKTETRVEAEGTIFNINTYDHENIKTTLFEGKITLRKGNESFNVKPGQQVLISKQKEFELIQKADIEQTRAWTLNYFDFNKQPFKEILNEIGRWYDVEIEFEGQDFTWEENGRLPRTLKLEDVIEFLQMHAKIKIDYKNHKIKVTASPS